MSNREYIPNKEENKRLKLQNQLLNEFDYSTYQKILTKYEQFSILDVGCGSGAMIVPKVEKFNLGKFVGIDASSLQIERAKEKFNNHHFYCLNVEDDDFKDQLQNICHELHINKFDVINLSMVLLHLKNPLKVLSILHDFLEDGGYVIIRDIDDRLNFVCPDEEGYFKRIYDIAAKDDMSGNRYMGENIYQYLVSAGYQDVELKKVGLSTAVLSDELKDIFYDMSFKAMMDRTELMVNNHPQEKIYRDNYLWVKENEDKIYKCSMDKKLIASLGFMSYIAKK